MARLAFLLAGALALTACATAPLTEDRYQALSPDCRALFDKYHQFMTDDRTEAFLAAPNDEARKQIVAEMHVEERLAHYPKFIQDAIWSRSAVAGMDKPALFLSLGQPDSVDRENVDPDTKELPRELWHYRRGPNDEIVISIVNDQVVDVKQPKVK
jgi:hypothetical protein